VSCKFTRDKVLDLFVVTIPVIPTAVLMILNVNIPASRYVDTVSVSEECTTSDIVGVPNLKVHSSKVGCSERLKSINDMLRHTVQLVILKLSVSKIIGIHGDGVSTEDCDETARHSNTRIFLYCKR
jgi:hypothetical protein